MKLLIIILASVIFISCGGSDGANKAKNTDEIVAKPDPTPPFQDLAAFEGKSINISPTFTLDNIQWEQLSGPEINIEDTSASTINITIPWITEPTTLVFNVAGEANGIAQEQRITLTILERNFYKLHVNDETTNTTDLYINYISNTDERDQLQAGMIQLTQLPENTSVCSSKVSPTGQYIAYGLDTGEGSLLSPICRGVYILDIESKLSQKLSVLGLNDLEVKMGNLQWSPDGEKLSYIGDRGNGVHQQYVVDRINNTVSYLNYTNNTEKAVWPTEVIFPIVVDGNTYNTSDIESTPSFPAWAKNNESLSFYVFDTQTGENYLEQGSIKGDVRQLATPWFGWDVLTKVDFNLINNSPGGECLVENCSILIPPQTDYTISWPSMSSFVAPNRIGSSTEGHLAFTAQVVIGESQALKVLAVRPPVIPGNATSTINGSYVEALAVDSASWSPTKPHLAFASDSEYRFRHDEEIGLGKFVASAPYPIFNGIVSPEIPGQLYFYENYEPLHTKAQERLSYPQQAIDDNDVRALLWAPDGESIAYARGESLSDAGAYYTSLWLTLIDNTRDETKATIDSNTRLLVNLRPNDEHFSDFIWAPDNRGLLLVVQTNSGTRLRYVSIDSGTSIDFDMINSTNFDTLFEKRIQFSPDGQNIVYQSTETMNGSSIPSLYIQSVSGGTPVKLETTFSAGASIQKIQWTPESPILAFFARPSTGSNGELFLANTNGKVQPWSTFLTDKQTVKDFSVDHDQQLSPIVPNL